MYNGSLITRRDIYDLVWQHPVSEVAAEWQGSVAHVLVSSRLGILPKTLELRRQLNVLPLSPKCKLVVFYHAKEVIPRRADFV